MNSQAFYYQSSPLREAFDGHKHYHDNVELYYLETGRCSYLIDDQLYAVEPGDLVLIPPRIIHAATYPQRHRRLLINCSEPYWKDFPPPAGGVYRNPAISSEIRLLFKEVEREYLHPDTYTPILLQGIIHRLLALIGRHPNLYPADRGANRLIEGVLKEMNRDFTGELTLAETARQHCVSPAHLSRSFKRETGMNFNEYLSLLRLKKAEQLLKQEPHQTIAEIAFSCGFNDSNYFSEKFRSTYGCSPSAFRKH